MTLEARRILAYWGIILIVAAILTLIPQPIGLGFLAGIGCFALATFIHKITEHVIQ